MIRNRKRKAEAEAQARAAAETETEAGAELTSETSSPEADSELAELNAKLAALEAERAEAVEQYKRALADYHNYQKRSVQNERAASEYARQDVMRDLIPILDNLDLAIEHGAEDEADPGAASLLQGVRMVQEALLQVVGKRGVRRLNAERGDEFDPTTQEAVMMQPTAAVPPQHVVQMIQVGYQMNETVLRPTKVVIAQPLPTAETATETVAGDGIEDVSTEES